MWVQIFNESGVVQGMLNIQSCDIVKIGGAQGYNFFKITVTKGSITKDYYIGDQDLSSLQRYLNRSR